MKKIFLLIGFIFLFNEGYSQEISCQKLFNIVTQQYNLKRSVSCYGSSMLVKATYYEVEDMGFVVAHIKENDYDIYGKPYIFCGISFQRWSYFKSDGMYGSWGKSFHKYIMDYTCDCY